METVTIHSPLHQFKTEAKFFRQALKGPFSLIGECASDGVMEVLGGVEVSHGHALEMLAILSGACNWKSLRSKLTDAPSRSIPLASLNLKCLTPDLKQDDYFFGQLDREFRFLAGIPDIWWNVDYTPGKPNQFEFYSASGLPELPCDPEMSLGEYHGNSRKVKGSITKGVEFIVSNYMMGRLVGAVTPEGGYAAKRGYHPDDFFAEIGGYELVQKYTKSLLRNIWKKKVVEIYWGAFRPAPHAYQGHFMGMVNALLLHLGYHFDGRLASTYLPEVLLPPPHWKTLELGWSGIG